MGIIAFGIIKSNGHTAGGARPLAISTACGLTEQYGGYEWFVVPTTAELGNNNANNGNYVARPVTALDNDAITGWVEAYHKCCAKKKSAPDCHAFRMDYERELWQLINEIYSGAYMPSAGVSFVVTKPCPREIVTSRFRDRIVQTWIALRIESLFEDRFRAQGNVSHNCRKGMGLLSAVSDLRIKMGEAWLKHDGKAYVGKMDVRGFFMSIDRARLLSLVNAFISKHYQGKDKELLLHLVELTIKHPPQIGAVKKSAEWMYELVPPRKRMEFAEDGRGLSAGNLNSQLMANFYMSFVVAGLIKLCERYGCEPPVEFVDDFAIVGSKDGVKSVMREAKPLFASYGLELHPHKRYLQQVSKGVKFVGSVIKPYRTYIANRTVSNLKQCTKQADRLCAKIVSGDVSNDNLADLKRHLSSLNSYLGAMRHTASIKLRIKLFNEHGKHLLQVCYTKGAFASVHPKREYNIKYKLLNEELNYDLDLQKRRAS